MDQTIQTITVYILPVIFAITLHEAAHGYVARHFGDATAWIAGRVSLNPMRHIDPVGTVLLPMVVLAGSMAVGASPIMFGWAKPVPVDFGKLRHPKQDMMWVALAGPAMNLIMAFGWTLLLKLQLMSGTSEQFFIDMAVAGLRINVSFMLLNLIPIPPLDGGRVAVSLLPTRLAWRFAKIEPYGLMILMVLLLTRVLSSVLMPFIVWTTHFILFVFALS